MTPLISYTTSKNWQRRGEQRTLTKHILLSPGWWVRTDNSDDGGVCARIHGCLLLKSSCFILLLRPSSATDFPGIFYAQNNSNNKESKNGINLALPAHCTGCFGYKTLLTWHRKMRFWPAPFYTGCESLANAATQSNTYSWSGSFLHRHYYLFLFRGCPLSQRPTWSIKKWKTSQNW